MRHTASVALLLATALLGACTSSPVADVAGPAFKADPVPAGTANLIGTFTSNRTRVPWSDGVTPGGWMDRWYVMKLDQTGTSLKGNAQGYAQYYYADGRVRTGALSTGGGIRITGTVSGSVADGIATLAWDGRAESKTIATYVFTISADGRTLTNTAPNSTLATFTR